MNAVPESKPATTWTESESDTATAKRIWEEYQRTHDVTALRGQAAGIDPKTGEVWIGKNVIDICHKRDALGLKSQLFFERIGFATYLKKRSPRRLGQMNAIPESKPATTWIESDTAGAMWS